MASPATIERKWYVVDATGYTLGRLSSEVAKVLRGKNKPIFTPHIDCGDYVIVVNADKVKVTGKKLDQKVYYNHSDYVGGMRETTLREMMAKKQRHPHHLPERHQQPARGIQRHRSGGQPPRQLGGAAAEGGHHRRRAAADHPVGLSGVPAPGIGL